MNTIKHGIKDLLQAAKIVKDDDENIIVRCNDCWYYFYDESVGGDNGLILIDDPDSEDHGLKVCPVCKTYEWLMDMELESVSKTELKTLQKELIEAHCLTT